MSMSLQTQKTFSIAGKNYASSLKLTNDLTIVIDKSNDNAIPAAKVGELTTRTDNDTGTLTMAAGHGIVTGDRLDVYWGSGATAGVRYGMTVGSVSGNSVPIDGGAGDNLPALNTDVTAMVPVKEELRFDGNDMTALVAKSEKRGVIAVMKDNGSGGETSAFPKVIDDAQTYDWLEPDETTNPLADAVVLSVYMSHSDSSKARAMALAVLYG